MKQIIVVDNQDITRIGIECLISKVKDTQVTILENKSALVRRLTMEPSSLIILDYTLSDFGGTDELLNLSLRFDKAHFLLFSEELSNDFLRRLMFASESFSVVLKGCLLDEIEIALHHAINAERYICARVVNQLLSSPSVNVLDNKSSDILTATEKEILKEIAVGKTTKEIAADRNLSFHTIITHRKNIFRKLEVNNVHEATKYAIRAGIIDVSDYYI